MAQSRDWRGRFAGGGGGGGPTGGFGPNRASIKGRTRGEQITDTRTGKTYGARTYSQRRSLGANRQVRVQEVRGGKVGATVPKNSYVTRTAVGTRGRVGTPLGGNRNARFVSRTHATTRALTPGTPHAPARGIGRAHSRAVVRNANRTGNASKVNGYIVNYGSRGRSPGVAVHRGG
jgi:hypothetical protein